MRNHVGSLFVMNSFWGLKLYFLFTAMLVFTACGDGKKRTEQAAKDELNAESVREQVLVSLGGSAITRQLHAMGSVFQKNALQDIDKVHHYIQLSNKGAAAANLGVYMSDLGYLTDYDQKADAKRYFEGCLLLANHVGMNKQFSQAVELRFSEIISGNEVLQKSLDRLFSKAENTSEEFKKMHASAITGYYVEELYHLAIFVQSSSPDENSGELRLEAAKTLASQKEEVGNLIGYFDHMQLKPAGISLYQDFLKLQSSYMALDASLLQKSEDLSAIQQDQNFADILNSIISIRKTITDL